MSRWEEFDFEARIRGILQRTEYYRDNHHFGRPFLTPYQIAIEFARLYPQDFANINLPIGGAGTGAYNSLAQYIAQQLSRCMRDGALPDFEGGFISNNHLEVMAFSHEGQRIVSSLTDTEYDLSLFRLRQ